MRSARAAITLATAVPCERLLPVSSVAPEKKCSVYDLAGKDRVSRIDAGIDQADGLAGAWRRIQSVFQFEVCVSLGCPDRGQAPLVLEVVCVAVRSLDRLSLRHVLHLRKAT